MKVSKKMKPPGLEILLDTSELKASEAKICIMCVVNRECCTLFSRLYCSVGNRVHEPLPF